MPSSSIILTDILHRLHATRRLQRSVDLRSGALLFMAVFTLSLIIVSLLETVFRFSPIGRTVLFLVWTACCCALFVWHVGLPLLRSIGVLRSEDEFAIARQVGSHFPAVHDRLLNLLQLNLEISSGKSLYSPELVDASFQDLARDGGGLDFTASVDQTPVRHSLKLLGASVAGAVIIALGAPSQLYDALNRVSHFRTEYAVPAEFTFDVTPGSTEIVKGQSVPIAVRVHSGTMGSESTPDRTLNLFWRLEGSQAFESAILHPDSAGTYTTTLQAVRGSTEYYAEMSGSESPRYLLTVVDRPVFRSFQIRLQYPAYTKLPPRVQEEFVGDVTALAGTTVGITGIASKELKEGHVAFGSGKPIAFSTNGMKFSASFRLLQETEYSLEVRDVEDLANIDPVHYQLKIVPDEVPSIAILQPGRNVDLAGDQYLRLLVQAKDDFGLSAVRIGYRLIHSRYEKPWDDYKIAPIPLPSGQPTESELPYTWDLSPIHLAPEDVVEYYAEALDNDAVHGPKSARTQLYIIRFPSLDEVFSELDKTHETSIDDLKQSLQDAKQLKENIESINQDMKKNKEMDWQQQKKMEEMAKKYQDLQKKLGEVQKRVDDMVQKMDQQKVLSKETMEKYTELQQLFEQLNSAELQQALKQMQQAMQNANKDQLQQAMQKLTFSEDQFRQSLERTIELLKRIQIEQKLDESRKRADELAKLQKDLNEESSKQGTDEQQRKDLAKKQSDLADKQQELEKSTKDVEKRMEEFFAEMPVDKMQRLNAGQQQSKLAEQMKNASQQLQAGQMQQAQSAQSQVAQQLQKQAEQLQSIQQEMLQKQMQQTLNALKRASNDMLELSKREESLKQQSQSAPVNSPQLRENAQEQMRVVQDMGNVVRGLSELSKRSFAVTPEMGRSIGEAMGHMQGALNALEGRNGFGASQEQGQSMASLNKTAMQIQNAMQSMMQGGGSGMGGLMQQLQAMAGQQQSINAQTQGMQQAADAARLAVEQEAVRKSLEQLNKEAQASGEQKRTLGDLEKIADEMREVVQNLQQNNVNPETIQKQERILSRLLDASKSMRERDYEKRRKSETGTQIVRKGPGELDPSTLEAKNKLLDELLKSLEHGYSKDYQELIRKYFDELQKLEVQKK